MNIYVWMGGGDVGCGMGTTCWLATGCSAAVLLYRLCMYLFIAWTGGRLAGGLKKSYVRKEQNPAELDCSSRICTAQGQ